jgi:large subunit ribosomal protein L10
MPTELKTKAVQNIEKQARESTGLIITSFKSLKTVEFNEMRAKLRPLKCEYRVVKNSLTRFALKNAGMPELADMLEGPTAIVLERGDAMAATKAVFEFAKTHENLKINGGVFEGKVLSAKDLKAIASLPSKEVLLAKLLGTLQAPMVIWSASCRLRCAIWSVYWTKSRSNKHRQQNRTKPDTVS